MAFSFSAGGITVVTPKCLDSYEHTGLIPRPEAMNTWPEAMNTWPMNTLVSIIPRHEDRNILL